MKLESDVTFIYAGYLLNTRPSPGLESAYNTYLHEGLPPGAIANPGLAAIAAVYNPQKTDCLFYLHDKNRKIHCAKTYEEHKQNISKYY